MSICRVIIVRWRVWLAGAVWGLGALAGGGCKSASADKSPPKDVIVFYFQTPSPTEGSVLTMPSGAKYRYLPGDKLAGSTLTMVDLDDIGVSPQPLGLAVTFVFDAASRQSLYQQTAQHQGLLLFTFVNDKPVGATMVTQPIENGLLQTFLDAAAVPQDQVGAYVVRLKASIDHVKAMKQAQ